MANTTKQKLTPQQKAQRNASIANGITGVLNILSPLAYKLYDDGDDNNGNDMLRTEKNTNYQFGDIDSLMYAANPTNYTADLSDSAIGKASAANQAQSVISGTAGGSAAGAAFGPWGAVGGAILGGATGALGNFLNKNKAKLNAETAVADSVLAQRMNINSVNDNNRRIEDNTFKTKALNIAAFGGLMNKYAMGGEFPNGVTTIGEGGTHEENPYQGVPAGVDAEGVPNRVEEGEVIYNDYVYSNRLKPTKKQLEDILLPKRYYGKTYAEIAGKLQEASKEMPYDNIERNGLDDSMDKLRTIQEETKQRLEQKRFMNMFNSLSDDDKFALINNLAAAAQQRQEEAQPQERSAEEEYTQERPQQGVPQEEYAPEEYGEDYNEGYGEQQRSPNEEALIAQQMGQYNNALEGYAFGGALNMFDNGGGKITYDKKMSSADAKAYEEAEAYKKWLKVIDDVIKGNADGKDANYAKKKAAVDAMMARINADSRMNGYRLKDYADYKRLASDGKIGPVHTIGSDYLGTDAGKGMFKRLESSNVAKLTDPGEPMLNKLEVGYRIKGKDGKERQIKAVPQLDMPELNGGIRGFDDYLKNKRDLYYKSGAWKLKYKNKNDKDDERGDMSALLRYMPAYVSTGAVLGDALGMNRPDYSLWDNASAAVNRRSYMSPSPIGGYLAYNPADVNYMAGALDAQTNNLQNNILNTSAGNRGAAVNALLAADRQGVSSRGDLYFNANKANDEQRFKIGQYNVGIDNANAGRSQTAQAQMLADERQRAGQMLQLAAQKQTISDNSRQTRADNLSNFGTTMGKVGKEVWMFDKLGKLIDRGVVPDLSAFGGEINRKKRRRK